MGSVEMARISCHQHQPPPSPGAPLHNSSFIKLYSSLITGDTVLLPGRLFGFNSRTSAAFCEVKAAHFDLIPAPNKQVSVLGVAFVAL